jgi:hypothetical protein
MLGYQVQLSDDGKSALVEMVFATPMAFQDFLQARAKVLRVSVPPTMNEPSSPATQPHLPGANPSPLAAPSLAQSAMEAAVPGLKMFERGKSSDQDILTTFRRYKANFTMGSAILRVQ